MLVRPCGVAAGFVHDAENRVGPDKIPRIDRRTALIRIAYELFRVDRRDAAAGERGARGSAVQEALVDIDPLLVFGSRAIWRVRHASPRSDAVAGRRCVRRYNAVIGDVVEGA